MFATEQSRHRFYGAFASPSLTASRTARGTFESRSYRSMSSGMSLKNFSVEEIGSYLLRTREARRRTDPQGEEGQASEGSGFCLEV